MTDSKDTSELTFEQAMSELEHIVNQLEQGDLPLEQSLQQFERAVALSRISQQKLQQAEQKVSVLVRQGSQETLQPMSDDEAPSA
ncbi:exodeoxyribonuclease VII small subunit [Aliidiomarina sedimenti]|uniref:Exodeoxyribonuclease 7 small subunit n=1 Tax=Aliidiomarina sedimenti TaxID=1933879 RepID=A0ABY0BV36_9GAMM|nr:exodeoxyribonuclease VII small subunit [Aliidiomarina sedimenti]RUO28069.1 exodeoxyribonuclease VII small subunit [Aliidiomarina sedimenti]